MTKLEPTLQNEAQHQINFDPSKEPFNSSQVEYLLDTCSDFRIDIFPQDDLTMFSSGYSDLLGWDRLVYDDYTDFFKNIHKNDMDEFTNEFNQLVQNKKYKSSFEIRYLKSDNTYIWLKINLVSLSDSEGIVKRIIGFANDISAFHNKIESDKDEIYYDRLLIEASCDYLWEYSIFDKVFTFTDNEYKPISIELVHLFTESLGDCLMACMNEIGKHHRLSEYMRVYNDESKREDWYEVNHISLRDKKGNSLKLMGTLKNVSDHVDEKNHLKHVAYRDALTNLYNRHALSEKLQYAFDEYKESKKNTAIFFFDLDNFKNVNDEYGHTGGDIVIKAFSHILKAFFEQHDGYSFRWGGEEFLCILPYTTEIDATKFAQNILDYVNSIELPWNNFKIKFATSCGISIFKDEDIDYHQIIQRADEAIYYVKYSSKNSVHFQK